MLEVWLSLVDKCLNAFMDIFGLKHLGKEVGLNA
jgi:hypothetical protein